VRCGGAYWIETLDMMLFCPRFSRGTEEGAGRRCSDQQGSRGRKLDDAALVDAATATQQKEPDDVAEVEPKMTLSAATDSIILPPPPNIHCSTTTCADDKDIFIERPIPPDNDNQVDDSGNQQEQMIIAHSLQPLQKSTTQSRSLPRTIQ
jgi:hypothetical protein